MIIEHIRTENRGERTRITAAVTWEDSARPSKDIYFETEAEFAGALSCTPHPFLVGSLLPALHHKERRVRIDGKVCPELRDGLITVMNWIRHWYYRPEHKLVDIEAKTAAALPFTRTAERTGFFFSGGVDCLATLRSNRINFPMEHPGAIRDGIMIYGQNIESDNRPETFKKAVESLSAVATDAGVTIVPVYTNIRSLDEDVSAFFINHGAILGAVAHALARRLSGIYISASDSIPGLRSVGSHSFKPHGSHPLIDPHYSSSDLRIRHDGVILSRLDKLRLLADWNIALENIKVCGPNWPGQNCGRCEKCVRTMLELKAAGITGGTGAFPGEKVTEEMISAINIKLPVFGYSTDDDYLELIEPLAALGYNDLVRGIEHLIARSRKKRRKNLRTRISRFDSRYLNGNMLKLKQALSLII